MNRALKKKKRKRKEEKRIGAGLASQPTAPPPSVSWCIQDFLYFPWQSNFSS